MFQIEFEVSGRLLKGHHSYKSDTTYVPFRANILMDNIKKIMYYHTDATSGAFEEDSEGEAGEDEAEESKGGGEASKRKPIKVLTTLQIHCKWPVEDFYFHA